MMIPAGQKLPQFVTAAVMPRLEVTQEFSLERYAESKNVLLVFTTGVYDQNSTEELIQLSNLYDDFLRLNTEVVLAVTDSVFAIQNWIKTVEQQQGIKVPFPVLSDKTMLISRALGVLSGELFVDENGNLGFDGEPFPQKSVLLVDRYGAVRFEETFDLLKPRDCRRYVDVIDFLGLE